MRARSLIMIGLALVFGIGAVLAGQVWLDQRDRQRARAAPVAQAAKPIPVQTIVVAALPLKFGTEVTSQHLREIEWPQGSVPKGAYRTIGEVLDGKTRRVALATLDENEPLLATKVTGPGQRASLAAIIEPGMKATTIRVNDVNGVAGFILPGERVDVILTRSPDKADAFADVLLQNMRVLAVDQLADERADKPALVKAVTLEATTDQTQKLALAGTVGSLSLVLRSTGATALEQTHRVAVIDLTGSDAAPASGVAMAEVEAPRRTTVGVIRGAKPRQEYSVPNFGRAEAQTAGFGPALAQRMP